MADAYQTKSTGGQEVRSITSEPPQNVTEAGGREQFLATFTTEDDKAIMKKVDRRFLLLIGILYMTKNIDYTNAANVKVLQVGEPRNILTELNMTANDYNWVQSIYFISYIVFEVSSNLLLKKMTPRIWQSRIILSWGIVLACHAAIQSKHSYYALRFLLGAMEAGLFPGLAVQLCSWYRSDEMGKPIMWMFGWQNCAGIVGSLLAYGISYMNGLSALSAWRWCVRSEESMRPMAYKETGSTYWRESSPFCSPGLSSWFCRTTQSLRDQSRWLTPREQEYLEVRLSENAPLTHEAAFKKEEIFAALEDPRTYAFMLNQLLVNLGGYGLS